eukprot:1161864-Pelagomonas_calceolata.AAC.11
MEYNRAKHTRHMEVGTCFGTSAMSRTVNCVTHGQQCTGIIYWNKCVHKTVNMCTYGTVNLCT